LAWFSEGFVRKDSPGNPYTQPGGKSPVDMIQKIQKS
jgi:hypothetical protein